MFRHMPMIAAVCVLPACQPAAEDAQGSLNGSTASAPSTADGPTTVDAAAPASLVGDYRVAGIDGSEVGGQIGIALSVTEDAISYEPRCAGFAWTYRYDRGALATERPADAPICEIAVDPELERLATALDAVTRAAGTPSNGIELTGKGHSVTLYSQ